MSDEITPFFNSGPQRVPHDHKQSYESRRFFQIYNVADPFFCVGWFFVGWAIIG